MAAGGELGPNGQDVERFIDRLHALSEGQLLRMAAFGDRARDAEHRSTYAAIGRRLKAADREEAVERGRDLLARWVAWREEVAVPGYLMGVDSTISDARHQALPAVYDATVAYIARDLLTAEEFDFLTAPLREMTGEAASEEPRE